MLYSKHQAASAAIYLLQSLATEIEHIPGRKEPLSENFKKDLETLIEADPVILEWYRQSCIILKENLDQGRLGTSMIMLLHNMNEVKPGQRL